MSLPGGTVEASKAKRIERQQARYRDRGGIFKPAEHNPLLELLLARGVNGESLSRANSPRRSRSRSTSPGKRGHARTTEVHKPSEAAATSKLQAKRRKSQAAAGRAKKQVIDDTTEEAPTAGPSRLAAASEPAKKGRATKATKKQTRPAAPTEEAKPKPKRARKRKSLDPDPEPTPNPDTSDDEPLAPTARKRAKTKASMAASSMTKASTKKPAATKDVDHADDQPAEPRGRVTKKSVKPEPAHEEADEPPPRTRRPAKRVRKTAVEEADELSEQPPVKKPAKGKQKAEPSIFSLDTEDEREGPLPPRTSGGKPSTSVVAKTKSEKATIGKHRAEDPDESSFDIPLAAFRRPTGRKNHLIAKPKEPPQATKRPSRREETDAESDRSPSPAPPPPTKRARSPQLTKAAKASRKRAAVEEPSEEADVTKPNAGDVDQEVPRKVLGRNRAELDETVRNVDHEARTEVEDAQADENRPRRKKRRPRGDDLPVAYSKFNHPNAPGKGDIHDDVGARKVSRTKAPPVPMPNGVRLKPKPRPRMSMFPPPVLDDEDTDRDPIDCFA